jgi:hypothetical protein
MILKPFGVVLRDNLNCLNKEQTVYSFSHIDAIGIFKRIGLLAKLQKVMRHSTINIDLTYLRGLEVAQLTENDMPMVSF